jgi:hypothetical protein
MTDKRKSYVITDRSNHPLQQCRLSSDLDKVNTWQVFNDSLPSYLQPNRRRHRPFG